MVDLHMAAVPSLLLALWSGTPSVPELANWNSFSHAFTVCVLSSVIVIIIIIIIFFIYYNYYYLLVLAIWNSLTDNLYKLFESFQRQLKHFYRPCVFSTSEICLLMCYINWCFTLLSLSHVTTICLSVCGFSCWLIGALLHSMLSHAGIVSKRLNLSSNCLHCLVAPWF